MYRLIAFLQVILVFGNLSQFLLTLWFEELHLFQELLFNFTFLYPFSTLIQVVVFSDELQCLLFMFDFAMFKELTQADGELIFTILCRMNGLSKYKHNSI